MVAQFLAALLYLGALQGELAHDPRVRVAFWDLLADARFGFGSTEEAMFVVRTADGTLDFVRWVSTRLPHQAQWAAAMPPGVLAIVHTHPNSRPRPSLQDVHTALRRNVPVYVLTHKRIMKTVGGEVVDVMKGDWQPEKG